MTELSDHLFRHEAGRMVATLTRIFGIQNLGLAEDVVQDAFCRALEVWKFRGVPENPSAWLMTAAKHRALDMLRRERTARTFAPELGRMIESESAAVPLPDEFFEAKVMRDDELRMMFSCCHRRLPEEAQIALILNILCGFSVDEVASAFISSSAALEKRISRSKKVLAGSKHLFDIADDADFSRRLPAVQRALYLLFNEGYHSSSNESAVRMDLCREAIRLAKLLLEHPLAKTPATHALAALMCFDAARLPARFVSGSLVGLFEQDRSCWDLGLVGEAQKFLDLSVSGEEMSQYHVEAAIAAVHAMAPRAEDTDWTQIVFLYDTLMSIYPSPVVALNRAVAVAQCEGPQRGLEEIRKIENADRFAAYPFYHAALGELQLRAGAAKSAYEHFRKAVAISRSAMEREFLERRANLCTGASIRADETAEAQSRSE